MTSDQLYHHIALSMIKEIGPVLSKYLISYCGSAEDVLKANIRDLVKIPNIGEKRAKTILEANTFAQAEKQLKYCEDNGIRILTYLDEVYPQRMLHYENAPTVLYARGNADFNVQRTIAIIGTRKMTERGRMFCEKLVGELNPLDVQVISGLAHGVDTAAHRESVRHQIPTVGVLGHGHDMMYPTANRKLAESMEEEGAVISEFPIETIPGRENFPARNRIIAMMSDAIVVVESGEKGGSIITANFGNEYNKDVFAVPGRLSDTYSKGCNKLIKINKAHLIESAADIEYIMRWQKGNKQPVQKALFVELTDQESQIINLIKEKECTIDEISYQLGIKPSELAALLIGMEFKGVIRALPGKKYVVC